MKTPSKLQEIKQIQEIKIKKTKITWKQSIIIQIMKQKQQMYIENPSKWQQKCLQFPISVQSAKDNISVFLQSNHRMDCANRYSQIQEQFNPEWLSQQLNMQNENEHTLHQKIIQLYELIEKKTISNIEKKKQNQIVRGQIQAYRNILSKIQNSTTFKDANSSGNKYQQQAQDSVKSTNSIFHKNGIQGNKYKHQRDDPMEQQQIDEKIYTKNKEINSSNRDKIGYSNSKYSHFDRQKHENQHENQGQKQIQNRHNRSIYNYTFHHQQCTPLASPQTMVNKGVPINIYSNKMNGKGKMQTNYFCTPRATFRNQDQSNKFTTSDQQNVDQNQCISVTKQQSCNKLSEQLRQCQENLQTDLKVRHKNLHKNKSMSNLSNIRSQRTTYTCIRPDNNRKFQIQQFEPYERENGIPYIPLSNNSANSSQTLKSRPPTYRMAGYNENNACNLMHRNKQSSNLSTARNLPQNVGMQGRNPSQLWERQKWISPRPSIKTKITPISPTHIQNILSPNKNKSFLKKNNYNESINNNYRYSNFHDGLPYNYSTGNLMSKFSSVDIQQIWNQVDVSSQIHRVN